MNDAGTGTGGELRREIEYQRGTAAGRAGREGPDGGPQLEKIVAGQARRARYRRVLRLVSGGPDHEILPLGGTMYQVGKSLPASLHNPFHYPVEARCERCMRRVVCDGYHTDWRHEEQES
jgi:hypothetical protein